MKTLVRSYSEEQGDFRRITKFITDNYHHFRTNSTMTLPRFVDWKYGLYSSKTSDPAFLENNATLWFDGFGRLVAVLISEDGDSSFSILTVEGYRFLFEEILRWAVDNWGSRSEKMSVELTEYQRREIEIVQRNGFRSVWTFCTRFFDLSAELEERRSIDDGFEIIDMETTPEYREQRILRSNAFEGKTHVSDSELEHQLKFYNNTHRSPIYNPWTDLCVKFRDGRHVAGCEALIDALNSTADIERVCTHSEFRRRGFAKALIIECLHRLKDMGFKTAGITGFGKEAIKLYGSLGASEKMESFIFELGSR